MLSIIPQTIRIPSRHIVTDSYVTFSSGANMWAITLVANLFYAPDDFFKKKNTSPEYFLLKHFCATRLRDAPCDASSLMTAAIHLIFGLKRCSKKEPSSDEQVLIDVDFWRFQQNYGRKAHVHWMQRATKTKCDVSATNHPPCESQMSGRKFCTGFLQLPETRRLRFSRRAEAETANGIWITQAPG